MTDDLEALLSTASSAMTAQDFVGLKKSGVDPRQTVRMFGDGMLGADDIAIKARHWERRFQGERAIIFAVPSIDGEAVIDLVAFRLDTPRSFWTANGHGILLGYDSLYRAEFYGEPLMVHECPLDWLRAGCKGIVILSWAHYWPAYLTGIPALQASSVSFGRTLQQRLAAPLAIPEIQVAA